MVPANVRSVVEVEVYSKAPNASVVQLPWRKFPGIVVQGDSLRILVDLAEELREALGRGDDEATEIAEHLHSKLAGLLEHYAQTLREAGIQLPYRNGEPGGE